MTSILYLDTIFMGMLGIIFGWLNRTLQTYLMKLSMEFILDLYGNLSYYLTNLFFHSSVFDHFINLILFFIVIKMSFDYVLGFFDKKKSLIIIITMNFIN